jgi:thioester reductase-like protein
MKTYFVTGASGAVGSAVVEELLRDPDVRLKLLIRAKSAQELAERLRGLLGYWGIADGTAAARIEALAGDTTRPMLGLPEEVYVRLASECTHVIHSAGVVRMNLPIEEARRSAVGAAREVIALARRAAMDGHLEKVEFVSTVGVGGRLPGTLPERWIHEPRGFHNTYEQCKAEAEVDVEAAVKEGLPITVHRPSMVVGDSRTGRIIHFQVFYHLAEFLSGARTRGILPDPGATQLDIVPCDYVAKAIVWSSRSESTRGSVLHLCAGPGLSLTIARLREMVRIAFVGHGRVLPRPVTVPSWLFRAAIPAVGAVAPERDRRALSTLPIFLDYMAEAQSFGNPQTVARLSPAGIRLPDVTALAYRILHFYLCSRPA